MRAIRAPAGLSHGRRNASLASRARGSGSKRRPCPTTKPGASGWSRRTRRWPSITFFRNRRPAMPISRAGDIITKFDGSNLTDVSDFVTRTAVMQPGRSVTLNVLRNGKNLVVQLPVVPRPPQETLNRPVSEVLRSHGLLGIFAQNCRAGQSPTNHGWCCARSTPVASSLTPCRREPRSCGPISCTRHTKHGPIASCWRRRSPMAKSSGTTCTALTAIASARRRWSPQMGGFGRKRPQQGRRQGA